MIFHHFTAVEYLDRIFREGLRKGDVPLTATEGINAVWLTTDRRPDGHGLTTGHGLSAEERDVWSQLFGKRLRPGARYPNKRAVRITVKLRRENRNLKHWPTWARKRLQPAWYQDLIRASGGPPKQARTWWLYFDVIPPEWFTSVIAC
jgi:hypothetical protein